MKELLKELLSLGRTCFDRPMRRYALLLLFAAAGCGPRAECADTGPFCSSEGTITAESFGGTTYTGTIAAGMLTWEGADYVRVP